MAGPGKWNFTIYQAATFKKPIQWSEDNATVDTTQWNYRCQLRAKKTTPEVIAEFTSPTNFIPDPNTPGLFMFWISPEDTLKIQPGTWVYDIHVTHKVTGDSYRLLEGTCVVDPAVTRPDGTAGRGV